MNCIPILEKMGYNLRGYSPDTYYYLQENSAKDEDECKALLYRLEREIG